MTPDQAAHRQRFERDHPDDEKEWSIGIGDAFEEGKPARLFVFASPGQLVEIREAEVTTWAATAREVSGGRRAAMLFSEDEIAFLLDVLPKALARRNTE